MGMLMKETEFERLLSLYGADISVWPTPYREGAKAFSATKAGQKFLDAEQELSELFTANVAVGHEHIEDRNLEAFLSRLEAVPENNQQEVPAKRRWYLPVQAFFEKLDVEISPLALASQTAALVVALGMGIVVGFNNDGNSQWTVSEDYEEIDISEVWFTENEDEEAAPLRGDSSK